MRIRKRGLRYPIVGALMALGAPAGLLLLRAASAGRLPTFAWAARQLEADPSLYAYTSLSTLFALVVLGRILGAREDELEEVSIRDPLTGLFNRRHLHDRLVEETRRAERYGAPLSMLLIDVDDLKAINDARGHAGGDDALAHVADALLRTCRSTDLPARYGGDEFIVLAPSTESLDAADLAERIRTSLHGATLADHPDVHVSVSIGVAGAAGGIHVAPEVLYRAADRALYDAKSRGRDRVVTAPPIVGAGE